VVQQPLLHHLSSCVRAPALVLSSADGQLRRGGVQGWFRGDRRMLSDLRLRVGGREPDPLRAYEVGDAAVAFTSVVRHLGDAGTDPVVRLERKRELSDRRLVETVTVTSSSQAPVELELEVAATSDLAPIATVRSGAEPGLATAAAADGGLLWRLDDGTDPLSVALTCDPAPDETNTDTGVLCWRRTLRTGGPLHVSLTAEVRDQPSEFTARDDVSWSVPEVDSADVRVAGLLRQSLADLDGLLLQDGSPRDTFLAAGSPWFLTLFGRDSLWGARMLLPLGTQLAMGTLRTLARRQGRRTDPQTEEEPGKILHEARGDQQVLGTMSLPPLYYGSVDATALFVVLLAEAWRWGADPAEVRQLLPHAKACLGWMERAAGDGFLRYVDHSGHGLRNQGWKDSEDGVQWADGTLAEPPIALSEVQAYAYQAAVLGADLLDAFGEDEAERWRRWAGELASRFHERFWVEDRHGRYPAVALDGDDRAVDSVASNMGHLLGTGLLTADDVDLVASRLTAEDMDSGFGLRTLTSRSPRYSALSYHGGSVWPHDTAIAVHGLCCEGRLEAAAQLLRGLVAAAPSFGYRLPELYAGDPASEVSAPAPYPSACRPQAWAAAAPLWGLVSVLGLDVDVPGGSVRVPARIDVGLGALTLRGLRVGAQRLDLSLGADGRVGATTDHPGLDVRSGP
jgi:glycogen debranching enzyme